MGLMVVVVAVGGAGTTRCAEPTDSIFGTLASIAALEI